MQKQFLLYLFIAAFLPGCKNKPAEEDIKRKIVLDYACPETVQVDALKIMSIKETTSFIDSKEYEYLVNGEIVWKNGCNEFGSSLPAGYKEKFENKKVILIKGDEGWR